MESSSEDSFAWTDASSESIDSDVMAVDNKAKVQSDNESEYGKSYKTKLQKELFAHNEDVSENNMLQKEKKRKINNENIVDDFESPRKKKIKSEPESDIEIPAKKKKTKYNDSHGLGIISKDSLSNDESYLNLRVKEELAFKVPTPIANKKKKKRKDLDSQVNGNNELSDLGSNFHSRSEDTSCNSDDDISQMMSYDENQSNERKKKKKKTKRNKDANEDDNELDFVNIKDKFTAEETVVETRYISNEHITSSEQLMENQNALPNKNESWNSDNSKHVNKQKLQKHNKVKTYTSENEEMSDADEQSIKKQQLHDASHVQATTTHNIPEKTNPRISRLSDRIRFEDENSMDIDNSDSNKNVGLCSRKWENFIKDHENLKPNCGRLKNESVLTQADEIWIVRCPHDINVNAFQNITIPLDKKCKIKVEESSYECSFEDHMNSVAVLSQTDDRFELKNLSANGIINLRKRVPKVHIRDDVVIMNNQTDFIPLPETKIRHPLFGPNYKKAVKLSGAVRERLQVNRAVTTVERNISTKHKKNKNKSINDDLVLNIEAKHEPQPLEEFTSKKKCKKRKHIESESELFLKQTKRQKYDTNSAEVWDSEQAIEENLFHFLL